MRFWQKVMAVMMALLWLPVSSHCLLETAEIIHHDACCQPVLGHDHGHGHGHDAADGNCQVESRQLAGQKQDLLKTVIFVSVLAAQDADISPHIPVGRIVADGVAPPEMRPSWQFISRAAVSPRAPSVLL